MGKSKKQSKGKKKTVPLVKADCDKTLSLRKTKQVKTQNSSLSCPEQVSPGAKSESCPVCLDKDDCLCAEKESQSKSVTDLGQVTRPVQDDSRLTRSLVELQPFPKPSTSMSSRSRSSRTKNVKSEELNKFKSEVSALSLSDDFKSLSDIKDDYVQSCTEVKTEFGKLLITACKQKLEDESENHNLAACGAEQYKRKYMPSVKGCRNFIRASGSHIKQAAASESHEETGKEEIVSSPKVVICPNDCLNLESVAKRSFQDDLKIKPESKKYSKSPDAQQDARPRNPIVAKNSSSIASFFAGFASHSSVEKEKGPDISQSCDSVSICRDIKVEGTINTKTSPNISLSTDVKDDASNAKKHEVLSSVSLIQNLSGTELQPVTELHIAPATVQGAIPATVQGALPPCKRRHKSERKSTTKKRSVQAPPKRNHVAESGKTVLPQSTSCKSSVAKTKSVKSENKDGKNQIKTKIAAAKDTTPNVFADTAGAPILTRSMIKTPGSSTGLFLPEDVNNSRKRRVEPREPRQNMRLEQHACLLWSSEQRRRFQQEHPEAKSDELDEIMRNYWKTMSERDCQRYIQRARNALNDRNGGLRTRNRNPPLCHSSTANLKAGGEHSVEGAQFQRQGQMWNNHFDGSAYVLDQRSKAVKLKLKYLQQNLSRFQYQKFVSEFQMRLTESQQNIEDAQNFYIQPWSDGVKNIQQQKFSETALKVMQKLIQDQEKTLKFARFEHKAVKHRRMLQTYEFLISEMAQDAGNCFLGDVKSELLTEILSDLEELEEDQKMPCPKEDTHASDHSDVEEKLKVSALAKSLSSGTFTMMAGAEEDSLPNVGDVFYQKVLLYETSCQPSLHQLHAEDVEDCINGCSSILEEASEKYLHLVPSDIFLMDALARVFRQLGGVEPCCDLNCPSCILTDLLIASKLQQLESGLQVDECGLNAEHEMKLAEDHDSDQNGRPDASQYVFNRGFNDAYINSGGGLRVYESETSKSHSDHYLVPDSELDGIFGVDTWLTAPIVRCPIQAMPTESCAVLVNQVGCEPPGCPTLLDIGTVGLQNIHANSCSDLGAWAFQEEHDEDFTFMQVLHDSVETISAVGSNN